MACNTLGIVGAALKGLFRRNGAARRNPGKPDRPRSGRERQKKALVEIEPLAIVK